MVIGNEPIWRKYYKRIMKNKDMVQYISDARNDGLDADEIVEYLLDWDENLNEDFTMGVRSAIGCRSRHTTFNGWLCCSNDEVGWASTSPDAASPVALDMLHLHHHIDTHLFGLWPLGVVLTSTAKSTTKRKKKKKKKKKSSKKKK